MWHGALGKHFDAAKVVRLEMRTRDLSAESKGTNVENSSRSIDGCAVSVRHVNKTYRTRTGSISALLDVTFDVRDHEFLCIVGPSGCGKTTILKAIAGLVPVTTGQITAFGRPVVEPYSDVGMVFQNPVLLRWRTALQNVVFPTVILRTNRDDAVKRARKLLEFVGLAGFESRYPKELSGGMQQRVAIARALIHDPKLLLMDEPFGALDQLTREAMNEELLRIWDEAAKTTVLITHSIEEAIYLADRVIVMSARPGRIAAEIPIGLPRPRPPEMRLTREFNDLKGRVEGVIRGSP